MVWWNVPFFSQVFLSTLILYNKVFIYRLESTLFSPALLSPYVSFYPLTYSDFLSFLLLFQLLPFPFSISLFPSTNWPSQASLGLYISGFEATSETKAKLWVWFGLRIAHWPRHVVFLGQTRERWGGEKNLCESSCVFEGNPITTANLNVPLSGGVGGMVYTWAGQWCHAIRIQRHLFL